MESLLVYCKHRVSDDDSPCPHVWMFRREGSGVIEYTSGAHAANLSPSAIRAMKARTADEMARNTHSISSQFRRAIAGRRPVRELPSPRAVERRREDSRQTLRAQGGSSNSELRAALAEMNRHVSDSKLFWDQEHSNIDSNIIVLRHGLRQADR